MQPRNPISTETAEKLLRRELIGHVIDKVSYYITGWELRLNGPTEYTLMASEITVPNLPAWQAKLFDLPIDISTTNEPADVATAAVIFAATGQWPISEIRIDEIGNLTIGFENGSEIIIAAIVDYVDWTWDVGISKERHLVFCDSGALSSNMS